MKISNVLPKISTGTWVKKLNGNSLAIYDFSNAKLKLENWKIEEGKQLEEAVLTAPVFVHEDVVPFMKAIQSEPRNNHVEEKEEIITKDIILFFLGKGEKESMKIAPMAILNALKAQVASGQ